MREDLLTAEEISAVIKEANAAEWSTPNLVGPSNKKASVYRGSFIRKGLIMINGNADTGKEHIQQRHRYGRQVWRSDKEKLSETSEIRLGIAPYDYLTIAESIYLPDNLRVDLNKNPNTFDLYLGAHVHQNGDVVNYILLTYKGTGIVHTLYPSKPDNARKKQLKYKRCGTSCKMNTQQGLCTYTIPYKNKSGNEVFRIVIRGLNRWPIVRYYIQIAEGNDIYPQTVFAKELMLNFPPDHSPLLASILDYADQFEYEKLAIQILDKKFDYDQTETLHNIEGRSSHNEPTFFAW